MRRPPKKTLVGALVWAMLVATWAWVSAVGNVQTLWELMNGWPLIWKWAAWLMGTPWLPLAIVAACLLIWGYLEWRARIASELLIELTPRWSTPIFATIINRERDYPAHVKRSTLYGLKKRWGKRQRLHDASKFKTSLKTCRKPPYTIDPDKRVEQAYGGYIPFEDFKFLQAEIELENGKIFVSKNAKSPKPPHDNQKRTESAPLESELIKEETKPKFKMESGPNLSDSFSLNKWASGPVRFLHPAVWLDSGTVQNCRGSLTRIADISGNQIWAGQEQLTFSSSKPRGDLTKTIDAGIRYFLDVIAIETNGYVIHVCNEDREWRRWPDLRHIFPAPGSYLVTVAIGGDGVSAETFVLRFDWSGNWQTSFLLSQDQITTPPPTSNLDKSSPIVAKRTISFDQESKIIETLKGLKLQPVWITTRMGAYEDDKEAHEYAVQITRVLSRAGVTINQSALGLGTLFPTGVSIFVKHHLYNEVTAAAIIDAVRLTGVECKTAQRQVWSQRGIEPEINLMIGANEIPPLS